LNKSIKLLIVTPYFPFPLNAGGNQAQFHLIDKLRLHLEISLLYLRTDESVRYEQELKQLWPDVDFYPYSHTFLDRVRRKIHEKFWCLIKSKSQYSRDFYFTRDITRTFKRFVSVLARTIGCDIIQVEFSPFLLLGEIKTTAVKLFVQHEIHHVLEERLIGAAGGNRAYSKQEAQHKKEMETATLNMYDYIFSLTEVDKFIMSADILADKIKVCPAAIPDCEKAVVNIGLANKLSFIGGETHSPNREGLDWFIRNCWDELKLQFPYIELHIIGKWSNNYSDKYSKFKGVKFLGFVEDIYDAINGSIMVVPILSGSGMRMKILEAARCFVPFVTTSIGVEGLPFRDGRDCLIGDTPFQFCEKVSLFIRSPALAQFCSGNSKLVFRDNFTPNPMAKLRIIEYNKMLGYLNPSGVADLLP